VATFAKEERNMQNGKIVRNSKEAWSILLLTNNNVEHSLSG
jgi:hypothetical protein